MAEKVMERLREVDESSKATRRRHRKEAREAEAARERNKVASDLVYVANEHLGKRGANRSVTFALTDDGKQQLAQSEHDFKGIDLSRLRLTLSKPTNPGRYSADVEITYEADSPIGSQYPPTPEVVASFHAATTLEVRLGKKETGLKIYDDEGYSAIKVDDPNYELIGLISEAFLSEPNVVEQ